MLFPETSIPFKKSSNIILNGDVFASLMYLKENGIKIDCAITSPPYWGQRDYEDSRQIGNEEDPNEFIAKLVTIFELLKDVLSDEGVFFLNIGDKYEAKYGNSSKLMIPYRLAFYMQECGWRIEDTLIWQKPNNMPSGVKNRLTNTYEPIFVCTKTKDNYYSRFRNDNSISRICKVNLVSSKNKHVAPYPTQLVENLLGMGIPNHGVILDPFAGSGTTSYSANKFFENDKLDDYFLSENKNGQSRLRTVDIEVNQEFCSIIRERNSIPEESEIYLEFIEYDFRTKYQEISETEKLHITTQKKYVDDFNAPSFEDLDFYYNANDGVKIFDLQTHDQVNQCLDILSNQEWIDEIDDDNVLFLYLFKSEIELYYKIWLLRAFGWIIRNIVIHNNKNEWAPMFMLVKDVKSLDYHFNIDKIRVESKTENDEFPEDVIGFKVKRPSTFFLNPEEGVIVDTVGINKSEQPLWIVVKWESGKIEYFPLLKDNMKIIPQFECSNCSNPLMKYYHYSKKVTCPNCSNQLWSEDQHLLKISNMVYNPREVPSGFSELITKKDYSDVALKQQEMSYSGKYKDMKKINIGQSPGARSMLNEDFFTIDRTYQIKQSMMSDYLNIKRNNKGISKKEVVDHFNDVREDYTHTVGHWFRKDKGGALPKYEDSLELDQLLGLDDEFLNLLITYSIKLVRVSVNKNGKNPGDYFEMEKKELLKFLSKVGEY